MRQTIGILYLCTGPYRLFWEDFYNSFERNFLSNTKKHYFVFCDMCAELEKYEKFKNVTLIHLDALPWPLITLLRFHFFLSIEDKLKKYDYLAFFNANVICENKVDEREILPRDKMNEEMSYCQHPGYYKKKYIFNYPYDRNKKSNAYIPYNCGRDYIIGAMFLGKSNAFLEMSYILKNRIDEDLKHNIIARWHDESHLNRYIINKKNYRLLSPAFCYPVGFDLPVKRKICGVSKSEKFDVDVFKGINKANNKVVRQLTRILKRIKNEGIIWWFRDVVLKKRIDII